MKKYISSGLCIIMIVATLIFAVYHLSNLLQLNSIVAEKIIHEKPPTPPPEGSSLSNSLFQPILMAGPGSEKCAPSPPPEESVN